MRRSDPGMSLWFPQAPPAQVRQFFAAGSMHSLATTENRGGAPSRCRTGECPRCAFDVVIGDERRQVVGAHELCGASNTGGLVYCWHDPSPLTDRSAHQLRPRRQLPQIRPCTMGSEQPCAALRPAGVGRRRSLPLGIAPELGRLSGLGQALGHDVPSLVEGAAMSGSPWLHATAPGPVASAGAVVT